MGGMASEGAYGEVDFGGGYDADPVDMLDSGELDRDQLDSYQNVLNSMKNSSDSTMDPMDGDISGEMFGVDESEMSDMSYGGATPLESNFSDWLNNNKDKLKDLPGGKGSGPQALGSSGSLKLADDGLVGAKGFGRMESPYAAPKYYTPQGSVEFQKMVSGLLSNVFGSNIRKPTIRSLI